MRTTSYLGSIAFFELHLRMATGSGKSTAESLVCAARFDLCVGVTWMIHIQWNNYVLSSRWLILSSRVG